VGRQGRSRGYALVDFSSGLEASSAVARLHGHRIGEREITVRTDDKAAHTATKPPKASAPGRNGGGGGSSAGPPAADGVRCYFGNLSWETTDADVQGAFPSLRLRLAALRSAGLASQHCLPSRRRI